MGFVITGPAKGFTGGILTETEGSLVGTETLGGGQLMPPPSNSPANAGSAAATAKINPEPPQLLDFSRSSYFSLMEGG